MQFTCTNSHRGKWSFSFHRQESRFPVLSNKQVAIDQQWKKAVTTCCVLAGVLSLRVCD